MLSLMQWVLSIVALLIIMITMFLRAADLKDKGFRWDVRRVGLVLAGVMPVGMIFLRAGGHRPLGWFETMFWVGLALVFLTTPQGIPWHKWVWKGVAQ